MITSTNNDKIKFLYKLKKKKYREIQNKYLLEGWHLIKEAILSNESIDEILVDPNSKYINKIKSLKKYKIIFVNEKIIKYLSDTVNSQGLIAVVNKLKTNNYFSNDINGAWLFMDNVQDPGNVGTMIRTADASGFKGVILGDGTADIYNAKTIRSMQGSQFHLNIFRENLLDCINKFKGFNYPVFGAEVNENARSYDSIGKYTNFAIIVGNEGSGIQPSLLRNTSLNIYIPILGKAESLNVAVAAGILMFRLKK